MRRHFQWIIFLSFCTLQPLTTQPQWEPLGPGGGSDLHIIAFHPQNPAILYTAGDIEGIFRSTDLGASWHNISLDLAQGNYGTDVYWINDLVFDPRHPDTLYLCTGAGLFRSTDAGDHWEAIFVHIIDGQPEMVSTIAIDPQDPATLYLGFGDRADGMFADFEPFAPYEERTGLLKSTDWGQSWSEVPIPLPDSTGIHSILCLSRDTLIVATTRGIWRSDDGGQHWNRKNKGLPHHNAYLLKSANVQGRSILFLTLRTIAETFDSAAFQGGIYRSDDNGDHWIDITGNLPRYEAEDSMFYDYWQFAINPLNPANVLISPTRGSHWERAAIYETLNALDPFPTWRILTIPQGQGWLDAQWFPDPYAFGIAFAPTQPAYRAFTNVYVMLTTDGGYHWHPAYTDSHNGAWQTRGLELMNVDALAIDVQRGKIYLGCDDMGLFRSDDSGRSFYRLDPMMDPVFGTVTGDGVKEILIDSTTGEIYLSRWPGSQGSYIDDYPAGGVLWSSDFGQTQQDITNGAFNGRCDLAIDFSTHPPIVYAAVYYDGIYRSTDRGQTWIKISSSMGSDEQWVWAIALDPTAPHNLWVGLNHRGNGGHSVYHSTDAGFSWQPLPSAPVGDVLALHVLPAARLLLSTTDLFDWSTQGGIFFSPDGGISWQLLLDHPRIVTIAVHPMNEQILAVGAQQWYNVVPDAPPGIFLSTDFGTSWKRISQRLPHLGINHLLFSALDPDRLYVATAGGGSWRSAPLALPLSPSTTEETKQTLWSIQLRSTAIMLDGPHYMLPLRLTLIDFLGRQYLSVTVQQLPALIPCSNLPRGLYGLRLEHRSATTWITLPRP